MFNIKRRLEKIVNKSAENDEKQDLNPIPQSTTNVKKTKREIELENLYLEASRIREEDFSKGSESREVEISTNVSGAIKTNIESDIIKAKSDSINDELKLLVSAIESVKAKLLQLQSKEDGMVIERDSIIHELRLLKSEIESTIDKILKL